MDCREIDSLLYPFLDGELEAGERFEIESHLGDCPACMARLEAEQRLKDVVRDRVALAQAPAALRARVFSGVRAEQRKERAQHWLKISAAALVVCAAGSGVAWVRNSGLRERYTEDAALGHARKLPVEVQQDTNEAVESWFDGKLDYHVEVPRLANARVTGARISNVSDKAAAYISYQAQSADGRARRVGVYVMDDAENELSAEDWPEVRVTQSHGYNVATWRNGEIVYELVSDLRPGEIRRMLAMPGLPSQAPRAEPRLPLAGVQPPASPVIDLRPVSLHP
jgi:mycothiol system anti-sigma-R factor